MPIHNPVVASLLDGLKVVAGANTLAVALTVGLILRLNVLSAGVGLVAAVCAIKLVIKPLLVWLPLSLLDLPDLGKHILILEAAMPSALLGVVLAKRYGCDGWLGRQAGLFHHHRGRGHHPGGCRAVYLIEPPNLLPLVGSPAVPG